MEVTEIFMIFIYSVFYMMPVQYLSAQTVYRYYATGERLAAAAWTEM